MLYHVINQLLQNVVYGLWMGISGTNAVDCMLSHTFDSGWFKFQKNMDLFFADLSLSSFTINFIKYGIRLSTWNILMTLGQFSKTLIIFVKKLDWTSFKFSAFRQFSQNFVELNKCHQIIKYGQSDVSKCLVCSHILKSIQRELNEKIVKI